MCALPQPPPPPPPPPLPPLSLSTLIDPEHSPTKSPKTDSQSPLYNYSDVCEWASEYPQLWELCVKNDLCLKETPFNYKYKQFNSILQVGPTCGLAALSMLVDGEVTASEMLEISRFEGFSNNGEMFSCKQMAKLAEKIFSLVDLDNVKCNVMTDGLFSKETIDKLLQGAVLLVPYDADCNHSPCLRNGHTAHWGIVCGVLILEDPGEAYGPHPNNIYAVCRHGKSRFLAAWDLDQLAKSNKNLQEFSPKKNDDGLTYVLPEGGIGGENGLRDQFVMLEGF